MVQNRYPDAIMPPPLRNAAGLKGLASRGDHSEGECHEARFGGVSYGKLVRRRRCLERVLCVGIVDAVEHMLVGHYNFSSFGVDVVSAGPEEQEPWRG